LANLLRDIIEGSAKTLVFINIAPDEANQSQTKASLEFAHQMKMIKSKPQKNVQTKEVRLLKDENTKLKALMT
jgi:hypothetical protein